MWMRWAIVIAVVSGCSGGDKSGEPTPPTDMPDSDTDTGPAFGEPLGLVLPPASLTPDEVGVIVNADDALSQQIADYYLAARGIPPSNVLVLSLGTQGTMPRADFATHQAAIDAAFGADIQALALTSMRPQRVDCMGAAAAFGLGFDAKYCQPGPPCNRTATVDYFNADSHAPLTDHSVRPAMIVAADSLADAKQLIDRGVASDATYPEGHGWLVRTTDTARSVRWSNMVSTQAAWDPLLDTSYVDNSGGGGSNVVANEDDVLFYFTGLASVPDIDTNTYVDGAVCDHLTSFGGSLPTSGQMTVKRWLQAGCTASYGTAIEPCNYTGKFPQVSVFLDHWYGGDTVVEAYWKSVSMPGEGNFVGEPLSRPFGGARTTWRNGVWTVELTELRLDADYVLEKSANEDGPWTRVMDVDGPDALGLYQFEVEDTEAAWYRLTERR